VDEDGDQHKDEDEDDGKESRMIGQRVMVNPSAEKSDTMIADSPPRLPEQRQEMCNHTLRPQPWAPAPRLETPQPPPRPHTPETHTLTGLQFLGVVEPQMLAQR
jgi:hypothetical protein